MQDKISYPQTIANARDVMTVWSGEMFVTPRMTRRDGHQWFTVDRDGSGDVNRDVQLYYHLNDLYIRGFRVGNLGYQFRNLDGGFMIAGGDVHELSYGGSYREMGWLPNRPITINFPNLNSALNDLRNCTASREPAAASMLRIVIAFSDGIRLSDVVHNIYLGQPILRESLDWMRRVRGGGVNIQVVKNPST